MVQPIRTFNVVPALPSALEHLRDLAYNLNWAWDHETIELFRRLDRKRWEDTGHNPVLLLGTVPQERLAESAEDESFLAHLDRVWQRFQYTVAGNSTWYDRQYGTPERHTIAYFSAEFGLTECLPIYSGGLGVLAGDHLKSASNLGLPLVGVGLLYQQGYFRQYLNDDGWQSELYTVNDFHNLPVTLVRGEDRRPVTIGVDLPGRRVTAQVWRVQVGRVPLYLLDTNISGNSQIDQDITDRLYGGDLDMRVRQEYVLGIGGLRALAALGVKPAVCHMNEGHSAFLALERIRVLMEQHGLSFAEAREAARAGLVFTTHTPVPAGNDYFPPELIDRYFGEYYRLFGLSRQAFLALGRQNPDDDSEFFCMTVLALRLSSHSNAVSRLHGRVSRRMWQRVWPQVPGDEVPIDHITNGIHSRSWISAEMAGLYDRYLGPRWIEEPADQSVWEGVSQIPGEELWRTHERRRERLVAFTRHRLRTQLERRGASPTVAAQADEVLDPDALTIGFARRFATYKRATLLLQDPTRLSRLLNDRERPVQIIFAGKGHPADSPAKELIRQLVHLASQPDFRRRIVFIEDYEMAVARYMVQGCDVWLNTPRRLLEASGTSGMKATANGAINISILDGWWDEAYQPEVGWAIGRGEEYEDYTYQDGVESSALYNLLEREVIPCFYDRGRDGLPRQWIARMKSAMQAICPVFNTNRMVHQYATGRYLPAAERYRNFAADNFARAKALAAFRERVRAAWPQVHIKGVEAEMPAELQVGNRIDVAVDVFLGPLRPGDVRVELFTGPVDQHGEIVGGQRVPLVPVDYDGKSNCRFLVTDLVCAQSGLHGYNARVLPHHEDILRPHQMGLISWARPEGQ